jgi:hypothetical protein
MNNMKNDRGWLTRSWYTLPRIIFMVGCCIFFALASFTIITDGRGFGCSISACLNTQGIDQSRPFDPTTQEPSIKDTFEYVTFNPILAPSLFLVRLVLPEQVYKYTVIGYNSFFIDRSDESFTFHTHPNVVISETDELDIKNISNTIRLLSLANIPIWILYSIGMINLAQRKPKLWYLWSTILLIVAILAIVSAQFSAEHFG